MGIGADGQQDGLTNSEAGAVPDGAGPGSSDGPTSADAKGDGGAPVVSAEGVVLCPYGLPADGGAPADAAALRTYQRGCNVTSDCAVVRHLNNCCGQYLALGANSSEKSRFAAAGGVCGDEAAACLCLAGGAIVDDGEPSIYTDGHDVEVACRAGRCRTYVPTFACGSLSCDSRTQFCEVRQSGTVAVDGSLGTSYQCSPIPAGCAATPTCACIAAGMPAPTMCAEPNGKVTVTQQGI